MPGERCFDGEFLGQKREKTARLTTQRQIWCHRLGMLKFCGFWFIFSKGEDGSDMTLALVTGGGGFVGRNLVEALQNAGRDVIAMVHSQRSANKFEGAGVHTLVGDMSDVATYASAAQRADEIYHLASVVAPKQSSTAFEVNVGGTQKLAECIGQATTPGKLIYISSLSASGPVENDQPRREVDLCHPVSVYGQSKLAAETELMKLADRLPISIVRPPGIFGPWDRNMLAVFRSVQWGMNPIGISKAYRYSFVHVEDLIAGLIKISDQGRRVRGAEDNDREGIYFIADPQPVSFETLGNLVADTMQRRRPFHLTVPSMICSGVAFCSDMASRVTGQRVYLNIDKMREARAGSWFCDVSRAESEVSFCVAMDLEQRLAQTQAWYVDRGWL